MYKSLASITGTFAMIAAALIVSGRADAGASNSAPSKYSHTNQLAAVHQTRTDRQARRPDIGITEYSSSARARSHGNAYH
ncbi:hypothetical protein SAMN05444169_2470 [Bradyrhizobium erythrophlei]|uniref:Uncharacterized protein n=1 Tax=Bradyrhizobium erythrophlei TaxID=1437360 RepID=A0A1M5JT88_9BRAD|nr:hypothetical protein SAMN05444169_2470 [Bradyrhizobium erythrophlei]